MYLEPFVKVGVKCSSLLAENVFYYKANCVLLNIKKSLNVKQPPPSASLFFSFGQCVKWELYFSGVLLPSTVTSRVLPLLYVSV